MGNSAWLFKLEMLLNLASIALQLHAITIQFHRKQSDSHKAWATVHGFRA